mgnify:CR=1 FL=1
MILCNDGRYLGYFHNLPEVLAKYPIGHRGWFFTNGETLSVWMWDELSRGWYDTNRADNTLQGMVDDAASFETGSEDELLVCAAGSGYGDI